MCDLFVFSGYGDRGGYGAFLHSLRFVSETFFLFVSFLLSLFLILGGGGGRTPGYQ